MFFQRKYKLRREFDQKLLEQLNKLKSDWNNQRSLMEKGFEPSMEIICHAKIAEAKYFYLFKEAKLRKIMVSR